MFSIKSENPLFGGMAPNSPLGGFVLDENTPFIPTNAALDTLQSEQIEKRTKTKIFIAIFLLIYLGENSQAIYDSLYCTWLTKP